MAYGNPEPADDNYSDAATPTTQPESSEDSGGETALLPKSICPGMKPGEELVLHVDRVTDDQYEVSYASDKGGEEKAEAPAAAPMPRDGEMASMME